MSDDRQYPFVLAAGIARPDFLIDSMVRTLNLSLYDFSFVSDRFHYFRGIASFLKKHGIEVYHSRVSFAAEVEKRAQDLAKEIQKILDKTGHDKVHIIAHSMGGLDARHMIVDEGMAEPVASLTTIGTPHFGTSAAEWVLEQGADKLIGAFRKFLNLEGIKSVTREACAKFNQRAREGEATNEVYYQTYASAQAKERVFLPFQVSWEVIRKEEGYNDGLVAVASQQWSQQLVGDSGVLKKIDRRDFPISADHLDQVGWWNLNELHKAGWWDLKALRKKNEHEALIKSIYLKICEDVNKMFGKMSYKEQLEANR